MELFYSIFWGYSLMHGFARILDDCTVDASLWDYHIMKQVITKSTKLPAN